jgi:hypothetical protein
MKNEHFTNEEARQGQDMTHVPIIFQPCTIYGKMMIKN